MSLRPLIRKLRYGLRDAAFVLFPGPVSRKRATKAAREMQRRAEGQRDPAYRPALSDLPPAPPASVRWVALYVDATDAAFWEKTEAATPRFLRHVQPDLPETSGAYDPAIAPLERQVALARAHGIDAFCFVGAPGGELPAALRQLHADPDLDISFCLLADGPLPAPTPALLEALADPRWLTVDGKPLVGTRAPDVAGIGAFQAAVQDHLGREAFLFETETGQGTLTAGISAAVQLPPEALPDVGTPRRIEPVSRAFAGRVDEQLRLAAAAMTAARAAQVPLFPGVAVCYDDTPLKGDAGRVMVAADPADGFARWLSEAAAFAEARPVADARLVFLNAWNDWPHGAHLEPGQRLGHGSLRAALSVRAPYELRAETGRSVVPTVPVRPDSVARVVHGFYPELLPRLVIGCDPKTLYVTTPPDKAEAVAAMLATVAPGANLRVTENRGRDVLPFLTLLPELHQAGFEYVLKVHTKRSPHQGKQGQDWLEQLSGPLLRLDRDGGLARAFAAHPGMGMLGAQDHVLDGAAYAGTAGNGAWLRRLCREAGLPAWTPAPYVAGTMFAARLSLFAPLLAMPHLAELFEPDMGLTDGTLAHAFERFFGVLAASAGQSIGTIANDGALTPAAAPVTTRYVFAPHDGE
ncbi:hypothetical protein GCM10007301_56040 [Azorhizobium oxalatiphilum]|uniref:Rhamnan synthesis protein F n=1 Tax=Azorhizobium oxalatiphilum TaxID=980631 RepID=A0A917CHB5_9HYPH|nr:glycoside hydrolase family 99-like domain-containing protein [Azorhizobium oxalatiphilum]GGF88918.1 hypothetical protein GCM10007301_56040 [Azorhizobium oxalatiphilum]